VSATGCVFCEADGGQVLWRDDRLRVIAPEEQDYPGFLRVVWNAHVAELTGLPAPDREHLMHAVFATESAMRELLSPYKINVASLGNVVPHLHWHVIPRFTNDPHFPNPVWGQRLREGPVPVPQDYRARISEQLKTLLS
jgi:diadenosine tetraphosphate (Ap4A) HIT family hydrolase